MKQPAPEQEKNGAMERMSEMLKQVAGIQPEMPEQVEENFPELPEQDALETQGSSSGRACYTELVTQGLLHRDCYTGLVTKTGFRDSTQDIKYRRIK